MGFRLITLLVALWVAPTIATRPAAAQGSGPVTPAPAQVQKHRSRGGVKGWARVSRVLRLPGRCRLARMKLKRSRAGRGLSRAGRKLSRGLSRASRNLRGATTWLGDRIELNTPTKTGRRIVHKLRNYNPMSLGCFALQKLQQDPLFLSIYGTWSFGFSYAVIPLSMGFGASLPLAGGIRFATGLPVDLAVLYWRQHHLMKKKDPSVTWGDVRRQLGKEYGEFVIRRRQENRDFMAGRMQSRPGIAGNLRNVAAPLVPQRVANP